MSDTRANDIFQSMEATVTKNVGREYFQFDNLTVGIDGIEPVPFCVYGQKYTLQTL